MKQNICLQKDKHILSVGVMLVFLICLTTPILPINGSMAITVNLQILTEAEDRHSNFLFPISSGHLRVF